MAWNTWRQIGVAVAIALAVALLGLLSIPDKASAADLTPLTAETLQQRVNNPVKQGGRLTVNLRNFDIDLTQPDLQDAFYKLLRTKLHSGSTPLALDLSYGVVRGDLDVQKLGLRQPLYGDALFPMLSEEAQAQLNRDRQRLTQLSQLSRSLLIQSDGSAQIYLMRGPLIWVQTRFTGRVLGGETFFLERVMAQGAWFEQGLYLGGARFNQEATFSGAHFQDEVQLRKAIFFDKARFDQALFHRTTNFQGAEFRSTAGFNGSSFEAEAIFSRIQWLGNADFARTFWQGNASFAKDSFAKALFLTEARFESPLILRQARFSEPVNLRNGILMTQADLGDATFLKSAYVNVSGLEFNPDKGEILGSPGRIGRVFSVPTLVGNETLLRNLTRNFRKLEQIADANQIEYTTERLRLREWRRQLTSVNLNAASLTQLIKLGFKPGQADAIVKKRQEQPLLSTEDLLAIDGVDLAVYVKVRDRILTRKPSSIGARLQLALGCLWLSGLIILSHYGTSFGLIFSTGVIEIALFAVIFWFVDRSRRRLPHPILPTRAEALWMGVSCAITLGIGLSALLRFADYPLWSLLWLGLLTFPVPALLVGKLLQEGRYHDLMKESYFVADGSMRQLRLLIARLPVIPQFPFYRDRYTPLPWERRWNWLNYYDFSLNNWIKFGFNDIRLRDQHLPGLITALVWYQWGLGLMYITLLLWTLSRTIPGLNLLLYF